MPALTVQTVINQPRAEVWSRLRDLRVARNYVPGVADIVYNTEKHEGLGASRKVLMKKRGPVDETVVAWDEGRGFSLKIHDGDKPAKPFSRATFQYALTDGIDGTTDVTLHFDYEVGMGIAGWLLDRLVLRRALRTSNQTVAANMKQFYETGQPTNTDLV